VYEKGGLLLINLYVKRPQKVSHCWVFFVILPKRLDYCVKLTCQSRTAFCSLDVKHSMRDLQLLCIRCQRCFRDYNVNNREQIFVFLWVLQKAHAKF